MTSSINDTRNYEFIVNNGGQAFLVTSSLLTLVGSLLIMVTFALYKEIRTSSRHIIVCISIADFITAVGNLGGAFLPIKNRPGCVVTSFLGSTALCSSFLWTMMLAVFLYLTLVKDKLQLATSLIVPWFHLICWGIPLVINIVAVTTGRLGNNMDVAVAGWCWITVSKNTRGISILWMFIDGKALELLTYIVIITLYVQIKCHLSTQIVEYKTQLRKAMTTSQLSNQSMNAIKTIDKKLIVIPIVYIFLRIWGTIRFFLYVAGVSNNFSRTLAIFQIFGDNLSGAVNCLLFCFLTKKVRNHMKETCKNIASTICSCRQRKSGQSDDHENDENDLRTRLL